MKFLALFFGLTMTMPQWKLAKSERITQFGDISAVLPWGDHYLLAGDEALKILSWKPGDSQAREIYNAVGELDLEAACSLGKEKGLFIGSHGRNGKGKWRTERHSLVSIDKDGIKVFASNLIEVIKATKPSSTTPFEKLESLIESVGGEKADKKLAPKEKGFNIEGMACSGSQIFLGLRSPTFQGEAFILKLLIDENLQFVKLMDIQTYNFGGMAIRDLFMAHEELYILTGPQGKDEKGFAIWKQNEKKTEKVLNLPYEKRGNPEALLVDENGLHVFLDCGDGIEKKEGGFIYWNYKK